jgi:hypothetical protein
MKKAGLFIAIALISAVACKKDEDTTRPEIKEVRVNNTVANEHEVEAGSTVSFRLVLSDNEALNQVKLDIHAADDGHTHEGEGAEEHGGAPNVGTWVYSQIINIDGTSATRDVTLSVPDSIQGYWHLEVKLIDEAGNEAVEYVTTMHVENPDAPVFNLSTTPPSSDHIDIQANTGSFVIAGTIADVQGLSLIEFELENHDTEEVITEQEFDAAGATEWTMPATTVGPLPAGDYHLKIKARDSQGNAAIWFAEVHAF